MNSPYFNIITEQVKAELTRNNPNNHFSNEIRTYQYSRVLSIDPDLPLKKYIDTKLKTLFKDKSNSYKKTDISNGNNNVSLIYRLCYFSEKIRDNEYNKNLLPC